MTWKNIVRKMPMPMNVATNRDGDFKQKIIQFEKEKIEPAFTRYTQSLGAGAEIDLKVDMDARSKTLFSGNTFYIGGADKNLLGGNQEIILNTIKGLYDEEGYQTAIVGDGVLTIKR
tara:strand:+ start:373 stop:723 length:351 start_codon:yes stop_codon:yes gene_type:complete